MTTTITTTPAEDARIAAAFGVFLGLDRNATAAEVKAWIRDRIVNVVHDVEARSTSNDIGPTVG